MLVAIMHYGSAFYDSPNAKLVVTGIQCHYILLLESLFVQKVRKVLN